MSLRVITIFKLFRGAKVYGPSKLGRRDVLTCGEKIVAVEEQIDTPRGIKVDTFDVGDKMVVPGYIDLTAPSPFLDGKVDLRASVQRIVESGAGLSRVTLSSDGNGSIPEFDAEGNLAGLSQGKVSTIHSSVKSLSQSGELSITKALELVTSNGAKRLGIFDRKGSLEVGKDADLIVLNQDFEIEKVLARGKFVLPLPRGIYW